MHDKRGTFDPIARDVVYAGLSIAAADPERLPIDEEYSSAMTAVDHSEDVPCKGPEPLASTDDDTPDEAADLHSQAPTVSKPETADRLRKLLGHIDDATRTDIIGWVWDPDVPAQRIRLELTDSTKTVATTVADIDRPDLLHAGIGDGRHAFHFRLPEGLLSEQPHTLHIRCAETSTSIPGSPVAVGPPAKDTATDTAEFGYCDKVAANHVEGWARDPTAPDVPLVMEVVIDGNYLTSVECNRPRYDAQGNAANPVGFYVGIPAFMQDGSEHVVEFRSREGRPILLRDRSGTHAQWRIPTIPPPTIAAGGLRQEDDTDTRELRVATTRFSDDHVLEGRALLPALREQLTASAAPQRHERREYTDAAERILSEHIDIDFYQGSYPDVKAAGIDPVSHYCHEGWKEGRDPTDWFDTSYYLDANSDIKSVGVNPFFHYVTSGMAEGRAPHRKGVYRREIVDNLVPPVDRTKDYAKPNTVSKLLLNSLQQRITEICNGYDGLALSVSHDCYVRTTGGIQIFLADEQATFASKGLAYLNVSPLLPRLTLAEASDEAHFIQIAANGVYLGITTYHDLGTALKAIPLDAESRRIFTVSCLLGHTIEGIVLLHASLAPQHAYFWLHDYSSLCLGFNLLRNNVEFCAAPPPTSLTCRVCIYGDRRDQHLSAVERLFEAVSFDVVAPSRAAQAIWQHAAPFRYRSSQIVAHCRIEETSTRILLTTAGERGTRVNPVRVAFIGYPEAHKGWPIFAELVKRIRGVGAYRMFHFCSSEDTPRLFGVDRVKVRTSPDDRTAMIEALTSAEIDLVLVLSPWPETFSYVTFEAMAAGCDVITLSHSGNVADTVLARGRGVVAADDLAFFDFFESLAAVAYVRLCYASGLSTGSLVPSGTTAAIEPSPSVEPRPTPAQAAYATSAGGV